MRRPRTATVTKETWFILKKRKSVIKDIGEALIRKLRYPVTKIDYQVLATVGSPEEMLKEFVIIYTSSGCYLVREVTNLTFGECISALSLALESSYLVKEQNDAGYLVYQDIVNTRKWVEVPMNGVYGNALEGLYRKSKIAQQEQLYNDGLLPGIEMARFVYDPALCPDACTPTRAQRRKNKPRPEDATQVETVELPF